MRRLVLFVCVGLALSGCVRPNPVPPTPPVPPPPIVEPIVKAPFWVVIVKDGENLQAMPPAQLQILYSPEIRKYCEANCVKGSDGKTPEFRIFHKETDVSLESESIRAAFKIAVDDMAKTDKKSWIALSNGKAGYSGPLPDTVPATLEIMKQYGPN